MYFRAMGFAYYQVGWKSKMSLVDRCKWLVSRRPNLRKIDSSAHWLAYIDAATVLAGNNRFAKGAAVHASKIGRHTYVSNARIVHADIGAFCSIGPDVNIGGLGNHPSKWISTHPVFYSTLMQSGKTFAVRDLFEELKPNKIGNDVWIGARALILDGILIGDGAIIAAGAVVNKDVPPYAVMGGVPASIIRYRFSAEVIAALQAWQWWSLPDEVLAKLARDFCEDEEWSVEAIDKLRARAAFLSNELDVMS